MKQDARSWSGTAQEKIRCQAVKAVLAGMTQVKAAETFGITRQAVGKWMVAQRRGGVKALRAREKGRPRTGGKIKESMGLKITQLITACFPDHLKLPFSMWTREAVCQLIRQRYGLKISISTMGRLLRRWGFTPQKPICHNLERSESEILLWKRQIFVTILKKAQKRRAYLVFIDEAGFMLEPLRRRTWAPRGCTPILKVPDIHGRISVIGAIAISPEHRHFSFHFHLLENNANFHGNSVVPFIEAVRRKIRSPFTLIWDQIRIHYAEPVKKYVATHPTIVVQPFPPYAPELNPVDNVWGYVKYNRLPNYTPQDLDELRNRITKEFYRLQNRPDLLESFYNHTGLTPLTMQAPTAYEPPNL